MLLTDQHHQPWNAFVAGCETGDFAQMWEWGDLKSHTGWTPLRFGVERDGAIVAGMAVLKRPLPGGKSLFYAPRGPLYHLGNEALLPELIAEVRQEGRRHGALALKIDPAIVGPNETALIALSALGFRPSPNSDGPFGGVQPRYVMKVDISGTEDELLASFHPKWRYNLRLAEKKGVVVTSECQREEIPVFYEVLQETCQRDGFGVRAISYYYDIWDLLIERDLGAMFLGRIEDQVICGALTFALGPQAWYVYGASSNSHRNLMPNHLMQWEMMKWARQRGCTVYDMRGVAREAVEGEDEGALHGLNRFKRGFGARYMEYLGEFDLVFSPLWYRLFNLAERLRRRGH
jgi:peptidoglycan pentaglycine glycine transferase (the first glycine)